MGLKNFFHLLNEELDNYLKIPDLDSLEELLIMLKSAYKEARKQHPKELTRYLKDNGIVDIMTDAKQKSIKLMKEYSAFELDEMSGSLKLYKGEIVEKFPLVSIKIILEELIGEKKDVHYYFLLGMLSIPEYYEMLQLKIAYDLKTKDSQLD